MRDAAGRRRLIPLRATVDWCQAERLAHTIGREVDTFGVLDENARHGSPWRDRASKISRRWRRARRDCVRQHVCARHAV